MKKVVFVREGRVECFLQTGVHLHCISEERLSRMYPGWKHTDAFVLYTSSDEYIDFIVTAFDEDTLDDTIIIVGRLENPRRLKVAA